MTDDQKILGEFVNEKTYDRRTVCTDCNVPVKEENIQLKPRT